MMQLPDTPSLIGIGALIVTMSSLAAFLIRMESLRKLILGSAETREIRPQPLEVRTADAFVTEHGCHERHLRMDDRLARIEQRLDAGERRFDRLEEQFSAGLRKITIEAAARESRLSDRIGDMVKGLAELEGYVRGKFEQMERNGYHK